MAEQNSRDLWDTINSLDILRYTTVQKLELLAEKAEDELEQLNRVENGVSPEVAIEFYRRGRDDAQTLVSMIIDYTRQLQKELKDTTEKLYSFKDAYKAMQNGEAAK